MCGLFGFINYSGEKFKDLADLTNSLAEQSAIRGTDATGISFCKMGCVNVIKESKSALVHKFKHSDEIRSLIGHTRHSTQGSEKKNYNNHPFSGKTKNARFSLAHNGVLMNDKELRKKLNLPKTKIETDSFIAVQLIESRKFLDFNNIKFMAEKIEGSFSFSILDDRNNVYLVKGDSPLHILHFPKLKMYIYASTEEILYKALVDFPPVFKALKSGDFKEINISEGDILKIRPDGAVEKSKFEYSYYLGRDWWDYRPYTFSLGRTNTYTQNEYIKDLKSIASCYGYSPDDVDKLLKNGFTPTEIEEYLFCMDGEV